MCFLCAEALARKRGMGLSDLFRLKIFSFRVIVSYCMMRASDRFTLLLSCMYLRCLVIRPLGRGDQVKREVGANLTRTRHCDRGARAIFRRSRNRSLRSRERKVTGETREGRLEHRSVSQETCLRGCDSHEFLAARRKSSQPYIFTGGRSAKSASVTCASCHDSGLLMCGYCR